MRLRSFCIGWGWRRLNSNRTVAMVVLFFLRRCSWALHASFHFFTLWLSFALLPHAPFAKYLFSCYPFFLPLLEHVSSSTPRFPPSTPPSTPPSNRRLCFRHVFLPSSSFLLSCRHSIGVSFAPSLFHHRSLRCFSFSHPPTPQAIETMVLSHRYECVPPVFFPSRSDRSRS